MANSLFGLFQSCICLVFSGVLYEIRFNNMTKTFTQSMNGVHLYVHMCMYSIFPFLSLSDSGFQNALKMNL